MTRRLALLLLFTTLIVACSCCSRSRVVVGTDSGTPHTPRMGALLTPVYPALPGSTVLQMQIDAGRTIVSGALTSWIDQSSNAYTFLPNATGYAVTSTVFQQYDGQAATASTQWYVATGVNPWAIGTPRTLLFVGTNTDAGGAFDPILSAGHVSPVSTFGSGLGTYYGNDVTNVTGSAVVTGPPYVMTWTCTPNGTTNAVVTINGWSIAKNNAAANLSGVTAADGASTNTYLGHTAASGAFYLQGNYEEAIAWGSVLSASALYNARGYEVGRFGLLGVSGYVSDAAAMVTFGATNRIIYTEALATNRLYTTSTSFTLYTQTNLAAFSTTILPYIDVFVDGAYNQTFALAAGISPYAPIAHSLTSAKLDGSPHVVDVWNATFVQGQSSATGMQGAIASNFQDSTGNTKVMPAAAGANNLTIYGDSISIGIGGTDVYTGGFARLRWTIPTQWNGRIPFYATSGRALYTDWTDDSTMLDAAAHIVAQADVVAPGGSKVVWVEMGTNDYGGAGGIPGNLSPGWATVGAFGTAYGELLDQIHTLDASIRIIAEGPLQRGSESSVNAASGTPFNLPALRTEIQTEASTRTSFVTYVDGSQPFNGVVQPTLIAGDFNADNVHPNDTGYAVYNKWLAAVLCYYFNGASCGGNNAIFYGAEAMR